MRFLRGKKHLRAYGYLSISGHGKVSWSEQQVDPWIQRSLLYDLLLLKLYINHLKHSNDLYTPPASQDTMARHMLSHIPERARDLIMQFSCAGGTMVCLDNESVRPSYKACHGLSWHNGSVLVLTYRPFQKLFI